MIFAYFAALSPNTGPLFFPAATTALLSLSALLALPVSIPALNLAPLYPQHAAPSLSLFRSHNLPILLILGLALLLALITVVKVSRTAARPLRPFKT